ncbi:MULTISPECIES: flagellar motor switch protein FliN [Kosakonia]|mgnify:CR=1 FL=1|jgi:flagellar motor switch protein FliN/FliY|uniref:Flagellar motor switch protein FliN n=1 Tax=Kosakonia cowanii JCM 10956 = DSM 18146 TaxID=1300165 RepID=A0A807LAY1_9ENTR|nr:MULTISPECIES: flagellar motor switch protein FliN [Kosakonia]MDP9768853.1 flagellar motor switch protein FliN/FliY [Atlantibacter hermannii]MDT3413393.1 flagellar motor switch protein FliN/FliY [Atlantibacter sp. SORGH_AS_0304]APZ04399.1 flagellar motor switch protein FliN [Kosakonia cowanii JCM 10956 = DSM 18146]MBK0017824.1 flagellar motor switch protein FliN [Kosakonia sp. S42]MDF2624014.1 flagellar motor switch protein FliN [Kosakonia cowanii]
MSDMEHDSGSNKSSLGDIWGDAMSEQFSSENSAEVLSQAEDVMVNLSEDLNLVLDIPVKMTVELGRTKMTIKELLRLSPGSIVSLDGLAGEPLDILINGYLIAQGEVVVVSDKFGIRITDIITPSERMHRLSR